MAKIKRNYTCQQCGTSSPKWSGKCDECGAWNSLVETVVEQAGKSAVSRSSGKAIKAKKISDIRVDEANQRTLTGISDFDSVLGGGLMAGGVILVAGQPGIGKSTILMQVASFIAKNQPVLYSSG